jgi:hypothetical protein
VSGVFVLRLYLALLHYPVYNKAGETIASAVTVMDLHDISRAAKTYEVRGCYVVTPLEDQRRLAEKVKDHWTKGYGALYNRDRKEAMELVSIAGSLHEVIGGIRGLEGEAPLVVATDASLQEEGSLSHAEARGMLLKDRLILLLFGTAWGISKEMLREADFTLEPIMGRGGFNHLSVRSAAAIILDRLAGRVLE